MHNVLAIARREVRGYFDSPIAYIVVVAFLLVSGWMFFSALFLMGRADLRALFAPSPFSPSMLLVILAPAVTMRLIAEERKSGTLELLTTLPLRDGEVILGKFLAAFALLATALGLTLAYALTVDSLGPLDWGPVLTGYLGTLLFAGSLLAVGLLCSTLTSNQIVAFIVAFLISATLYFVYWLQFFVPSGMAPLVEFLSTSSHLENLSRGVIDSRDVLYYLTLTGAALFGATRN
jgi:ABC-2 type transport system permease protein